MLWTLAMSGEGPPIPDEECGMPIYEYKCDTCEHITTLYMKEFTPPIAVSCQKCKSTANRLYTPSNVHYKTTGFTKSGPTLNGQV